MKNMLLREDLERFKKTRDKLQREIEDFDTAISELERLGTVVEGICNVSDRFQEYNEIAIRIPIQRSAIVGKLLEIGTAAIQDYCNLGGEPEMKVVHKV